MPRAIAPEVTTTTSTPGRVQRRDLLADPRDDRQPQRAGVLGDDRRAELDDGDRHQLRRDPARRRCRRSRRRRRPRSPARSSAPITPMRRSRCSTAPAPPRSRGPSAAIRRSTESPVTIQPPSGPRVMSKRLRLGRAEDRELGHLVLARALGLRLGDRHALEQLAAQLGQPDGGRARGDEHRERHALAPLGGGRRGHLGRARGRPCDSASSRGRPASRGSCSASSRSITSKLRSGSEPSSGARSSTCTSSRVRSTCARKSWPSPAPSEAPSISPGMSASTSWRSSASIVPSTGSSVVNGYAATFGCARVIRASSEDLPAFGQPDEADVGEQLQVQLDRALLARQARARPAAAPGASRSRTSCCRARRGRRVASVTSWPGRTRS